jgi:selenide, water dikinase
MRARLSSSSGPAAAVLLEHGARACTDVTGFGLLGHLIEMIRPSGVDVELWLDALPILDGAAETVALGIMSSLQPANIRLRRAIRNPEAVASDPRYPLLFRIHLRMALTRKKMSGLRRRSL